MRQGIHPDYKETTIVCSCGERFTTRSTAGGELHVELCSSCHPFYTGKQKFVDTGGRVQRFSDKFGDAAQVVIDREAADRDARIKAAEEAAEVARQSKAAKDAAKAERAARIESGTRRTSSDSRSAAAEEPAVEEPVAEEPAAEEPAVEETAAEETASADLPVVEAAAADATEDVSEVVEAVEESSD